MPAAPDFRDERASIARVRVAVAGGLAAGQDLIDAIGAGMEHYGLTKGEADGRQNHQH